ncbi:MAG TPA: DUF305 domain-containing protein [Thermoanaerobaculia bacterium]|nr:DUF305 domain-containing protein [Thermoanaerobaculia bacterium]
MSRQRHPTTRLALTVMAVACAVTVGGVVEGQTQPKIIQPGAPGEPSREISAEEASDLAGILYTAADVEFMRGMIAHHAQAIRMTDLLASRTESEEMRLLAQRIELSQRDEIEMMEEWLRQHDQDVAQGADAHHAHQGELMPGMLTAEQMSQLEQTRGGEFDRLFLELMIAHHQGALVMVDELLDSPGGAQESTMFGFTTDVTSDQSAEIDRMAAMLESLSSDPRVGLDAGFRDAGEASWNMQLIAALPKPVGFFSPDAPEGLPVPPERKDGKEEGEEGEREQDGEQENPEPSAAPAEPGEGDSGEAADETAAGDAEPTERDRDRARRRRGAPLLNFANSDLAFARGTLFEGNFHGFNSYSVEDPTQPRLLGSVVCPGGQGDVSVVGDLLLMSVEQTRGRLDCGLQGVAQPMSAERFRGIRIFDIANLAVPRQVAAVQTCRGSHTHTVVTDPDDEGNIYIYVSGTSSVRSGEELAGCSDKHPGEDESTALFSIDVILIPTARPEEARVVSRPRIFADPDTGAIAGLWRGGTHGTGTQKTAETDQCHDITTFPELGLAAGACSGNGILLDISDPVHPVRLDQVTDPGFAYWHSATFNHDGTKVIFTDEWGGGMRPRCRASDPKRWGANAIFDIADGKLQFRGYFKMPAPQSDRENCVAHNGSLVPIPGRDVMVQAWYQGGISVFDFTDSARPVEIAFFDRGPISADKLILGGHWSAYWYDGFIYGTEIARGLDVLKLLPSEHLSQNELDAAALIAPDVVNVQQQRKIEWPASPVVARAYLDQLARSRGLATERTQALTAALERADAILGGTSTDDGSTSTELRALVAGLDAESAQAKGIERARLESLVDTVERIAARLR